MINSLEPMLHAVSAETGCAHLVSATGSVLQVGGGRGFVVEAAHYRYIVTAAHCLPFFRRALHCRTRANAPTKPWLGRLAKRGRSGLNAYSLTQLPISLCWGSLTVRSFLTNGKPTIVLPMRLSLFPLAKCLEERMHFCWRLMGSG